MQRALARDHLVTGGTPTMSAGGSAFRCLTGTVLGGTGESMRWRVGLLGTPGVQRWVRASVTAAAATAARYTTATRASA